MIMNNEVTEVTESTEYRNDYKFEVLRWNYQEERVSFTCTKISFILTLVSW